MQITTQFDSRKLIITIDGIVKAWLHTDGSYTKPHGGVIPTTKVPTDVRTVVEQALREAQAAYHAALPAHIETLPYHEQMLARVDVKEQLGWLTPAQATDERRGIHAAHGKASAEERERNDND